MMGIDADDDFCKKNTAISIAERLVKQYFKADVNQYNTLK